MAAKHEALTQRHRCVLHDQLTAEEIRATGPTLLIQLRERLEEEEQARKGVESDLSACRGELQAYKDKSLEWCASYMEAAARVRTVEEQYRLDRKEWEDDLKDMREQRDQYKAAADSYRYDRFEEDRLWQEDKARAILEGQSKKGTGKRPLADQQDKETRKQLKGKRKESESL